MKHAVGHRRTCCGRHSTPGTVVGRRQCGSRLDKVPWSPRPRPCRHPSMVSEPEWLQQRCGASHQPALGLVSPRRAVPVPSCMRLAMQGRHKHARQRTTAPMLPSAPCPGRKRSARTRSDTVATLHDVLHAMRESRTCVGMPGGLMTTARWSSSYATYTAALAAAAAGAAACAGPSTRACSSRRCPPRATLRAPPARPAWPTARGRRACPGGRVGRDRPTGQQPTWPVMPC